VRPALCPTIPHHCDDSFFVSCRDLAAELDLRVHTHLGESKVQAVVGLRRYGESLAAHLDRLGVLGPRFTAAHGVWLDDDDVARLADRGASLAHNPTSNLRLGVGIAPVDRMRRAGLAVGIGTDGSTCSDGLGMFEATRAAALVSRARSPDPDDWLDADEVLRMATEGGAAALGFGDAIGRIAPGAKADLVLLRLDRPEYWPLNDAPRQVVFLEGGAGIDRVMVGGRSIVVGGECVSVDMAALRRDVERLRERIARAGVDAARLVAALEPVVGRFCVGLARVYHHVERYAGGSSARDGAHAH
jgi:guanine deaminase